jgi:hypothetical protein
LVIGTWSFVGHWGLAILLAHWGLVILSVSVRSNAN